MKRWSDLLFRVEHDRPRAYRSACLGFVLFVGLFWIWIVFFSGV